MLAGLRSRCTTPRSCASSSAAATSLPSLGDLLLRRRPAGDVLCQRLARHVLHDQEVDALAAVEVVHRGDVRVVQAGQRLRFTAEPPPCSLVGEHPSRQHLEGDVAVEVLVAGAIDLAHPAFAQLRDDLIVTQCLANHDRVLTPCAIIAPGPSCASSLSGVLVLLLLDFPKIRFWPMLV